MELKRTSKKKICGCLYVCFCLCARKLLLRTLELSSTEIKKNYNFIHVVHLVKFLL